MNLGLYTQLARIEEQHWWFRYRRRLVRDALTNYGALSVGNNARALDVGCGTGGNLKLLSSFYPTVVGIDYSPIALKEARLKFPDAMLIQDDANRLGDIFRPQSFDLVTLFNVLYHKWIESDIEVLTQIHRILKLGGILLITEPAFPMLMRHHDLLDYGRKRYRKEEFRGLLKQANFNQFYMTLFNSISFIPALMLALKDRLIGTRQKLFYEQDEVRELQMPPPWLNQSILGGMELERQAISLFGSIPLGITLLGVGIKGGELNGV
ncbi:MAG: class I SAM-dependent methyltransferase [Magnetococcales bacterium]|nr:class I SAM-dependent methyltransferase [Magnetococcales bacterium]